ncbi:MAG: UvrD-helicase domain-containing protein, partial [Bacteroidales bacterium]|nr:UvrD-helicase domain-containing protein [Bacteroidales bacterium]
MMNNSSTVFEGLNEAQRNAVACTDGPVLIVAGAGSGKTRVLTSRIAYLLEKGVEARSILALTFTKKAAGEMKERIALMVGEERARRLVMGTFHAVFVRFLREYAADLGYPESFTIYDQSDSTSAVKACIKELGLDDKVYKPREVLARISKAKNNLVTADAYRNNPSITTADAHARKPRLGEVYSLYVKKCKQSGVMDFDDILLNMNYLLRDFPAAREAIGARFRHILVDEYQDTNYAQYLILKKLAQNHRNICVVGDDSQSIYAFRGARVENILNFKKDYPECKTFRLERNYRSTRTIVSAANSLIAKNQGRIPKNCYSEAEEGEKIRIINAYTEQEEAQLIVSDILDRMRLHKARYEDFAVLYRTNAQSRALEEALRRRNIPYRIYSGNSFFERAEVKDMMAWFKLAVNPDDDESFKRAVGRPSRGIGGTTMEALAQVARAGGVSLRR